VRAETGIPLASLACSDAYRNSSRYVASRYLPGSGDRDALARGTLELARRQKLNHLRSNACERSIAWHLWPGNLSAECDGDHGPSPPHPPAQVNMNVCRAVMKLINVH
jgi:hypothetical protein